MPNSDFIFIGIVIAALSFIVGYALAYTIRSNRAIFYSKSFSYEEQKDLWVLIEAYDKGKIKVERPEPETVTVYNKIKFVNGDLINKI